MKNKFHGKLLFNFQTNWKYENLVAHNALSFVEVHADTLGNYYSFRQQEREHFSVFLMQSWALTAKGQEESCKGLEEEAGKPTAVAEATVSRNYSRGTSQPQCTSPFTVPGAREAVSF